MTASLPYLTSPGSIATALERIRAAATPDRVTGDFVVKTMQMKGGTGKAIIPYLKKIGFVAPDGTPTEIYKRFRNKEHGALAAGEAILYGYKDLAQANEKFYDLDDKSLKSVILQVSGLAADSNVVRLIHSTILSLKKFAKFEDRHREAEISQPQETHHEQLPAYPKQQQLQDNPQVGFNLAYTINLNLPATTDQAVFNAIFKSLKEHLLSGNE